MQRWLYLFLIWALLMGCARDEAEVFRSEYHHAFEAVFAEMDALYSMTKYNEVYRETMKLRLAQTKPQITPFFEKYQNSPAKSFKSFEYLQRSLEGFILAERFWGEQKGVYLVRRRMEECRSYYEQAAAAFTDETGIVLLHPGLGAGKAEAKKPH
jgi:hypothetical protein